MLQVGFTLQKFFQLQTKVKVERGKMSLDKKLIFDLTARKLELKRSICISNIDNNSSNSNNSTNSNNSNNQFTSLHHAHTKH